MYHTNKNTFSNKIEILQYPFLQISLLTTIKIIYDKN